MGARLRLVTFIVSPPRRSVTTTVTHAETQVFNQWMIQIGLAQREAADYLQSKGVKLEAQKPQGFNALDITLPVPTRWSQVPDPNVPDAFAVIADRLGSSLYTSNAQVVVYKLVGNFDPREAITHGFVDSQQLSSWQTTNASQADFMGFPSSIIEGTYRQNDSVDVVYERAGRRVVATGLPVEDVPA